MNTKSNVKPTSKELLQRKKQMEKRMAKQMDKFKAKRMEKQPDKRAVIPTLIIHVIVLILTWRDIASRTDDEVRGNKAVWRVASALNTIGSVAYWIFGRKPRNPLT
ncbi:PLD nuclease N-terminal domain-containing protein [Leifsonia sp. YAF41]|uniref:PLD nuclease N-terminal domain-containing protein n=1 Tax=Leifsonia sp. YAF41 TaxID=3233086 RepID=UPI003F94AAFB